jgi:hypothetical protein
VAHVLNMGNRHSVTSWCRVAEAVMGIMAHTARVVVPIYIDDASIFGTKDTHKDAIEAYEALAQTLGLELSKKEVSNKESMRDGQMRILGLDYQWQGQGGDRTITITVPDEKYQELDKLILKLQEEVRKRQINMKTIQSLVGMACFIVVSSKTRSGAELLRGLYSWTNELTFGEMKKDRALRRALARSAEAIRQLAKNKRPHIFKLTRAWRPTIYVQTDASSDGGRGGEPMLAAMMADQDGNIKVAQAQGEHGVGIETQEAWAVRLAQIAFSKELKGADVVMGIDNIGVAYAHIKATSRSAGIQKVVIGTIKEWHEQETCVYYTYVLSEDNVADAWTRWERQRYAQKILGTEEVKPQDGRTWTSVMRQVYAAELPRGVGPTQSRQQGARQKQAPMSKHETPDAASAKTAHLSTSCTKGGKRVCKRDRVRQKRPIRTKDDTGGGKINKIRHHARKLNRSNNKRKKVNPERVLVRDRADAHGEEPEGVTGGGGAAAGESDQSVGDSLRPKRRRNA